MIGVEILYALGPKGTFGHEAAYLAQQARPHELGGAKLSFVPNNAQILDSVRHNPSAVGVVPIENGKGGLVAQVVDYWMRLANLHTLPMQVVGEIYLPVKQCLLSHPSVNDPKQLNLVISHDQALTQCRDNLSRLGLLNQRPTFSTAAAAKSIKRRKGVGAIASEFAANTYGLKVLVPDFQDAGRVNVTRFHLVGHKISPKRTQVSRTAVLFWLKDKPGSLDRALECISVADANKTSIHSIPLGQIGHYAFYVEFEVGPQDQKSVTASILTLLKRRSEKLLVLGTFPVLTKHKLKAQL